MDGWRKRNLPHDQASSSGAVAVRREEEDFWEGLGRQGRHDWGKRVASGRWGPRGRQQTSPQSGLKGNSIAVSGMRWCLSNLLWLAYHHQGMRARGSDQGTSFLRMFWFWRKRREEVSDECVRVKMGSRKGMKQDPQKRTNRRCFSEAGTISCYPGS